MCSSIFATDLDRTIVFSDKFASDFSLPHLCVEFYEGRGISYISHVALKKLKKLQSKYLVVPVTTRSKRQYERISIFSDSKYAITSNGGTILENGKPLKSWEIHKSLLLQPYLSDFPKIQSLMSGYSTHFTREETLVDDVFYFTVLKEGSKSFINSELTRLLKDTNWVFTIQGSKLYIIPSVISKEGALSYLKDYLSCDTLITSGDGKLDFGMLSLGDVAIVPNGSEVISLMQSNSVSYLEVPEGLHGTPYLLDIVEEKLKCEGA